MSTDSTAFLSHIFDDRVSDSILRIKKICEALSIKTVFVNNASPYTPGPEAAERIEVSDFLIAVCTRKNKLDGGTKYLTSTAVREEMAIAVAKKKNIVCFVEKDVELDGFGKSLATYVTLEDAEKLTPEDVYQLTKGIYDAKQRSAPRTSDILLATQPRKFVVTSFAMKLALVEAPGGLTWDYVIEREYRFETDYDQPLVHAAYCPQESSTYVHPPLCKLEFSLNGVEVLPELEFTTSPGKIAARSKFGRPLTPKDQVRVLERYRHPLLAPAFAEQSLLSPIEFAGKRFDGYDGLDVVSRIEELRLMYEFPRGYVPTGLQPVVGTFSYQFDQPNEHEIERLINEGCFKAKVFDKTYSAELTVQRPLYQYFYGVGWKLPVQSSFSTGVAAESDVWD